MEQYIKDLLNRSSFDRKLFLKELEKVRRWLTPEECELLDAWVKEKYADLMDESVDSSAPVKND